MIAYRNVDIAPQPRWATHESGQNGEKSTKEGMHRRDFKRSAIAERRRTVLVMRSNNII